MVYTVHNNRRSGFTLIELLVVIAIIALLVGLLVPALGAARQVTRDLVCVTNVRSMSQAMSLYADGNKGGWYTAQTDTYGDDLVWLFEGGYLEWTDAEITVCPHTENVVDVIDHDTVVGFVPGQGFVASVTQDLDDLRESASNRTDDSGGHSYEIWAWFASGEHVDGTIWVAEDKFGFDRNGNRVSLSGNTGGVRMTTYNVRSPSTAYLLLDSDEDPTNGVTNNNWPDKPTNNHRDRGVSLGFTDGHAEFADKQRYVEASLYSYHTYFGNASNTEQLARSVMPEVRNEGGWNGRWWLEYGGE